MAITAKAITLWRREIDNRPGELAGVLQPLAAARADIEVLMAYRFPGDESRGAVELFPVTGKKGMAAAKDAGLAPAEDIPALLVQGPNRAGIGAQTSRAIADAGINLAFLVAQTVGTRFSAVYGFDNAVDRDRALKLLRKRPNR